MIDAGSGKPLRDVYVGVEGLDAQTTTDGDGRFVLPLPAGRHKLQVAFDLYEVQAFEIDVMDGRDFHFDKPIALQLESKGRVEKTVIREPDRNSAEAANLQRKAAAAVSDRLSAEEIKKTADGSASQAAARVVGATIVGDRFVYVRGLGERYANALFNGAPLPSPEPDQQAVPFDIFPANLLANLTLIKSATPDLPADFAGGSVQINSRDFPGRRTVALQASLGGNLQTVLQPMLSYPGGSTDFLGIDDGTRAQPVRAPGQSAADFGRSFPNIWSPTRRSLGSPNYALSGSYGDTTTIGGKRLGYLAALSYSADAQTREEELRVLNLVDTGMGQKALRPLVSFGGEPGAFAAGSGPFSVRSTQTVQWSALSTVSLLPAIGHRLTLTGIFTQSADRESRIYQGFSQEQYADIWNSRLRFVARSFGFAQLGGSHHLQRLSIGGSDIDWSMTYAVAARAEPDNREVTYIKKDDGLFHFTPKGTSGQRFYSQNVEHQLSAMADYTQAFGFRGRAARFKLGGAGRFRFRDFSAQRYKFGFGGLGDVNDAQSPEAIFAPENIGTQLDVRENSNTSDKYNGTAAIYAAYAMIDLPLSSRVRLTTGLRFEASQQRLHTRDPRMADQPIEVALDTYDPLPSANLVVRVHDDMNVRLGGSMTVARPDFRELAPFQFADFFGGELVQGNPALQRTRIGNADLRWEWFLGPVDLIAVSAFYKYFDQPIETTINAGGDLIRSFANAHAAHNVGAEIEGRKELLFAGHGVPGLSLGANLSLIYSRVDLTGVSGQQTSKERALQGQSPFVVNAFVEWDRPSWGTQARVLYNVFGERIDQVGAFGLPDKFEQPRHNLDVIVSQRLPHGLSLRLSARNLINSPVQIIQRGMAVTDSGAQEVSETTLRYRTGQVVTLSLGYSR